MGEGALHREDEVTVKEIKNYKLQTRSLVSEGALHEK
jgi:hypothetical protein